MAAGIVITDEQLMMEARGGSREAFETLFERYRDAIWRFFRRRERDAARAEELSQDVFLALLGGASRYEPRALFRAYLFGIAYRVLLAERRKTGHRLCESLDFDPARPGPPDADAAIWVRSAIAQLDADDREMLMLREYEELSYQEIADVCRIPLNTVRSRLFRARMALKTMLSPDSKSVKSLCTVKVDHGGR